MGRELTDIIVNVKDVAKYFEAINQISKILADSLEGVNIDKKEQDQIAHKILDSILLIGD